MSIRRLGGVRGRTSELAALRARLEHVERELAEQAFARRHAEDRLADAERRADALAVTVGITDQITATTALVSSLAPATALVSVILATRNRAHLLPRALASVHAQSHAAWELIAVDDSSTDETPELLAAAAREDSRIQVMRAGGDGASAARNLALDHARGEFVAYLDDDNVMGPHWLRALVWAFDRHPEADVGYGARVMDDAQSGAPWVELQPWDRHRMQVRCLIDQNMLTHRSGLPEVRYDTAVDMGSDWDAAMRATDDRDPVMIPVVASIYGTASNDRMSERPEAMRDWVRVQRAALRRHPLRVLCVDLAAPPLDEAGAVDAVRRWQAAGAEPGWCAEAGGNAPPGVPSHTSFERAVREFSPAFVAVHAGKIATAQLARLARAERAFVIVAPLETSPQHVAEASRHPLCAGVWGPEGPAAAELLSALDLVRVRQLGLTNAEDLLAQAAALPELGLRGARSA